MHIPSQILAYTPEDSRIEPENTGLVQMIFFFFQGAVILRWTSH